MNAEDVGSSTFIQIVRHVCKPTNVGCTPGIVMLFNTMYASTEENVAFRTWASKAIILSITYHCNVGRPTYYMTYAHDRWIVGKPNMYNNSVRHVCKRGSTTHFHVNNTSSRTSYKTRRHFGYGLRESKKYSLLYELHVILDDNGHVHHVHD